MIESRDQILASEVQQLTRHAAIAILASTDHTDNDEGALDNYFALRCSTDKELWREILVEFVQMRQ